MIKITNFYQIYAPVSTHWVQDKTIIIYFCIVEI